MTNEQRVRVDRLERYLITDREKTYTTVRVNDLDTALSLIKEQQEEIEIYTTIYPEALIVIAEQEKQIDLMAEQLAGLTIWNIEKDEPLILGDKEEVKQYFERKVEDVKD